MRSSSERIGLPTGSQMGFLVIFVSPDLVTAIVHVLTSSTKTTWLTHFEKTEKVSSLTNKTSTGKGTCQLIVAITSIKPQISMNLVDSACRGWPVQYKNRLREWKTKFSRFWKTEKCCPFFSELFLIFIILQFISTWPKHLEQNWKYLRRFQKICIVAFAHWFLDRHQYIKRRKEDKLYALYASPNRTQKVWSKARC